MQAKSLLLLAGLLWSGAGLLAGDYAQQIETARADRLDRLTQPDGWLALIGTPALPPGVSTIGRAAGNRIILAAGPEHFGTITLAESGRITFSPAPGSGVLVDGVGVPGIVELRPGDAVRRATLVTAGTVGFYLVESGGRETLHVRDVARPQLVDFPGLDYFPIDPAWRIEAEWIVSPASRTLTITDIAGGLSRAKVTGKAVFRRGGNTFELLPTENPDGTLLFVLADTTSGAKTYAMRFLVTRPRPDGKIILDFNLAENPPCAFSALAVCPLPPKENRLPFAVTAGEKIFRGSFH